MADNDAAPYVDAAQRKIKIAGRHLVLLNEIRRADEIEELDVQLHFDGLLQSGASASDKLAVAIGLIAGIRKAERIDLNHLLTKMGAGTIDLGEIASCADALSKWANERIVRDARGRRNLIVHRHYKKTPSTPELAWCLYPIKVEGKPSPYEGPLDVHAYSAKYVATLERLDAVATGLIPFCPSS